jgi:hypothetical protein
MVNHDTVKCEQVWRQISNYIEGEVDASLSASMEEHFRSCERCASVLAGTRNVIRLYSDERMLQVPAGFGRRLERRLARNVAGLGTGWSTWSTWLIPVAAVAMIAGGLKLTNALTFQRPVKSILAEPGHDIPADLQVVVSNGSKVFHVPGCTFIHDKASERTLTAKAATQQGYAPCARCLRQYLRAQLSPRESEENERVEFITAAGR